MSETFGNGERNGRKDVPYNSLKKLTLTFLILWICGIQHVESVIRDWRFGWICSTGTSQCRKIDYKKRGHDQVFPTVELCRLACGDNSALWPKPQSIQITNKNLMVFNPEKITIETKPAYDSEIGRKIISIFTDNLRKEYNNCRSHTETKLVIRTSLTSNVQHLDWNTDESYTLKVDATSDSNVMVTITGTTIFGARHALESLSQLMTTYPENDNTTCLALLKGVKIDDKPVYSHRGLLLDSSRNFLSIKTIKKHIKAMAASKMNFLHWHITDSHSFPLETPRVPNMTLYGAYSPSKMYPYRDIKDLFQYALARGVRIILELDAPSHAGFGWQWGPEAGLGNLTVCLNHQPWRESCIQPPCGQLNPSNPKVYDVLQKIYSDMVGLLPWSEIFHMGGDELFIPCWNSTDEIIRYIGNKPRTTETFLDLWAEFQREALRRYDNAAGQSNSKVIVWTSHLTDPQYVEKYIDKNRYVIQTWVPNSDDLPNELLRLGYKLIISTKNAWYLDHGFWGTTTYYDWRTVYSNRISLSPGVLGGEVCMWGEYVDDNGVISRTWPRAAAAAERLWSNPSLQTYQVEARFYRHRERLVTRGIGADAVIPKWCYYNEGQC